MVFLSGPRQTAGRKFLVASAGGVAAVLALAAMLGGCGGGGSADNSTNNPAITTATVTGRLIESTTTDLISGAVVTFGDQTTTTGASGQFTFTVPGNGDSRTLLITLPSGLYFARGDVGDANGTATCVANIGTTGIPVDKSKLVVGSQFSVGNIKVYSQSGPPPPPCAF